MKFLRRASVNAVFGGSMAVGLQQDRDEVVSTPDTTEHMHDGAESEVAGTPNTVNFVLNRAMRREYGIGPLSAPEGIASNELEATINGLYAAVEQRNRSTQRTQF